MGIQIYYDSRSVFENDYIKKIAEGYVENNCVVYIQVDYMYGSYNISGRLNDNGDIYNCEFMLSIDGDISDFSCNCLYSKRKGLCAHIGAILITLESMEMDGFPFVYNRDNQGNEDLSRIINDDTFFQDSFDDEFEDSYALYESNENLFKSIKIPEKKDINMTISKIYIPRLLTDSREKFYFKTYTSIDLIRVIKLEEEGQHYSVNGIIKVNNIYHFISFQIENDGTIKQKSCSNCSYVEASGICSHIALVLKKLKKEIIQSLPYLFINLVEDEDVEQIDCLFADVQDDNILKQWNEVKNAYTKKQYARFLEKSAHKSIQIIKTFQETYEKSIASALQKDIYELQPAIHCEKNICNVEYKVGKEKYFVIKDLDTFLQAIQEKSVLKYGKSFSFIHDYSAFSQGALTQISFIEQSRKWLNERINNGYHRKEFSHKPRYIQLNEDNIDLFYDTYVDYDLEGVRFQEGEQLLTLVCEDVDNYYILSIKESIQLGKKYVYRIYNEEELVIERYELDDGGYSLELLRLLQDSFVINKNDYEAFYKYAISHVREYFDLIDLADVISTTYQNIKIYGDIDEKDRVYFQVYYEDDEGNRIAAFQQNFIKNFHQDYVEQYLLGMGSYDAKLQKVFVKKEEEQLFDFLQEGIQDLTNHAKIYISDRLKKMGSFVHYKINVGIRVENNLLHLDINSLDIPKLEIGDVLNHYQKKKKYYRLKNGEFLYLNSPELAELSHIMNEYHVQAKDIQEGTLSLDKNRMFSIEQDLDEFNYLTMEREESFLKQLEQFYEPIKDFELSPYYNQLLRDYQKEGVRWLMTLHQYGFHGILADDMGLGKTLQVITFLDELKLDNPSIVICPASLIYNWQQEVEKFAPHMKVCCIVGNQQNRQECISSINDYDLIITSYDYIRRDVEFYKDVTFAYIVLDESQYIKNLKTKNAQAVKQLNGKHKLALSGTPIENTLAELWSVFDFLMPSYLFNYHYFRSEYEIRIVKEQDEECIQQLKKLVTPFILRRNKKDVLKELPDKIETTQKILFSESEQQLYLANLAQVNEELQTALQQTKVNKVEILAMLTRLRQICCEPRMLYENINQSSSKLKACMELITSYKENNQKVLVFSAFTSVFNLLEDELRMNGISYYKITGETSKELRREYVDGFQNNEVDVFLISLKAGGTGLNLTAAEAVIHFDPWWNLSAQNQATDRAYRIGQKRKVQVHKLIMKNSIEERILQLQERKKELADAFVENNEGSISALTKEDLIELFTY